MENYKSPPATEAKLHFLDYWRIIRIRKTVILAVFLLVVLTTTAVTYILPKSYMSVVRMSVDKDVPDVSRMFDRQNASAYDPYFIQTQFEIIQSSEVLYKVIEKLDLNRKWSERFKVAGTLKNQETLQILKGKINVRQFRNTSIIEIRVFSEDKDEASDIANTIASEYRDFRQSRSELFANEGIRMLEGELEDLAKMVELAQARVDELRISNNIADINPDSVHVATLELDQLRRLEGMRGEAMADFVTWNTLLANLKKLANNPEELRKTVPIAYPTDQLLIERLQELARLDQAMAGLAKDVSEEHPDYVRLKMLQTKVNNQVNERLDGVLAGLEIRVSSFSNRWDALHKNLEALKKKDSLDKEGYKDYITAKRDLEARQQMRIALMMKISQEQIDVKIPRSSVVEITDKAEPGLRPVRPNKALNIALGIIVGLIVGVGLAFFIEYLDTSVKTIDDIERALQAPVLGVIPQNVGSLLDEGAESPHAEAYRVLRTNLLFSRKDEKLNTITVVSGGAGEGKSTTLWNLATVFAQAGQRVLIVDSDLRRPSIHKFLKVSNVLGLTNYLMGQAKLEEVIQTTPLPSMDFMPSGKLPSSSMGILSSVQMKDMIKELKRRYEFVFFDSPPIMGVSDASILASEVDLSLQVIQYRKYPQAMTIRAKQMVEKVGGNLIGVVLNNINISQDSYYYYYAGYYYDYYSKHDEEASRKNGEKKKAAAAAESASRIDLKQKF